MTGVVPVVPRFRFTDPATGLPLAGGSVTVYLAGTTTLATTYQNQALGIVNTNPVTLDANGECLFWVDPNFTYKLLLKDATGATMPGWPQDDVAGAGSQPGFTASLNAAVATATAAAAASQAAAALSASSASSASATSGAYPNTAASNVPRGLTQASVGAITPGSGGTNGTFAVAWSGGNFSVNPTATFTVAGGALTAVTITGPGLYIGTSGALSLPSPSFAASAGLTGAAVALTAQFLVTSGQGYWVTSSDGLRLDRYKNNSGVATADPSTASIYTSAAFDDAYNERFLAAQNRYLEEKRLKMKTGHLPKALVFIALGQSNNVFSPFDAAISGTANSDAKMPFAGNCVNYFPWFATNQNWTAHWNDFASFPQFVEGPTGESSLSGAIVMLQGIFPRIYAFSAAGGGRAVLQLSGDSWRTLLYAATRRMCDQAIADGYDPFIAFTYDQGEANMSGFGQVDETTYKSQLQDYLRLAQLTAAQAMDKPDYIAPIVFHTVAEMDVTTFSKGINNGIVEVARGWPNAILASPALQWPVSNDMVHNTNVGYRKRSEQDGYLLAKWFVDQKADQGVRLVDAVRSGTTLTLTFSQDVVFDTSIGLGTSLNAANAFNGIEYTYDGTTFVKINTATVSGRVITCTLASNPGTHAGTEEVRIGVQKTNSATTWPQQSAGASIRSANDPGFVSPWDGTTTYLYAASHYRAVR